VTQSQLSGVSVLERDVFQGAQLERVKLRINASPPPDSRRLRVNVAEPRTMATSTNY